MTLVHARLPVLRKSRTPCRTRKTKGLYDEGDWERVNSGNTPPQKKKRSRDIVCLIVLLLQLKYLFTEVKIKVTIRYVFQNRQIYS